MPRSGDPNTPLAAVVAVAVVCCAALPPLAGAFAGLALAAILGVSLGLLALTSALAAAAMGLRARRRRSGAPTRQGPAR
jgi:hypothetical protein